MVTDGVNDRQEAAGREGVDVRDVAQLLLESLDRGRSRCRRRVLPQSRPPSMRRRPRRRRPLPPRPLRPRKKMPHRKRPHRAEDKCRQGGHRFGHRRWRQATRRQEGSTQSLKPRRLRSGHRGRKPRGPRAHLPRPSRAWAWPPGPSDPERRKPPQSQKPQHNPRRRNSPKHRASPRPPLRPRHRPHRSRDWASRQGPSAREPKKTAAAPAPSATPEPKSEAEAKPEPQAKEEPQSTPAASDGEHGEAAPAAAGQGPGHRPRRPSTG